MNNERQIPKDSVLHRVLDAVDLETFLVCDSETEGKGLALRLLRELGFADGDIVSIAYNGVGVRVRLRGTLYKPGDEYHWDKDVAEE